MISQQGKSVCSVLIGQADDQELPKPQDLQKKMENGSEEEKLSAIRELLICILNDESYPKMMMTVFKSILPLKTENHEFKKVMLLYWEVIEKLNSDGNLKDEFYLVNNHFRNDILHANEYIRGRTLRLLTRVMLKDVIMPLISSIVENLTYKNAYVRRAAVNCLYHIFLNFGTEFLPDIDDTVYDLLQNETRLFPGFKKPPKKTLRSLGICCSLWFLRYLGRLPSLTKLKGPD
jgi:coatomer subunit beta